MNGMIAAGTRNDFRCGTNGRHRPNMHKDNAGHDNYILSTGLTYFQNRSGS